MKPTKAQFKAALDNLESMLDLISESVEDTLEDDDKDEWRAINKAKRFLAKHRPATSADSVGD